MLHSVNNISNLIFVLFAHFPQILDLCVVWPPGNSPNRPSQVNHLGGGSTTALFLCAPKIRI